MNKDLDNFMHPSQKTSNKDVHKSLEGSLNLLSVRNQFEKKRTKKQVKIISIDKVVN